MPFISWGISIHFAILTFFCVEKSRFSYFHWKRYKHCSVYSISKFLLFIMNRSLMETQNDSIMTMLQTSMSQKDIAIAANCSLNSVVRVVRWGDARQEGEGCNRNGRDKIETKFVTKFKAGENYTRLWRLYRPRSLPQEANYERQNKEHETW